MRRIVGITVEIHSEDAAMDTDPRYELATMLRDVVDRIAKDEDHGMVRDSNGNKAGEWYLDLEED